VLDTEHPSAFQFPSDLERFEVMITDHQLRPFVYIVVTRFGPLKAVFVAAESHSLRYKSAREYQCRSVSVRSHGIVDNLGSGELGDIDEEGFPF
jgi:hypothetical protein